MDNTDLIAKARELCDKATPGPWESKTNCHPQCNGEPWGWIGGASGNITWSGSAGKINAAFIAASRTLVPQLCDALEEAEKEIERLTARAEKAEAALRNMRFAYLNKDPDCPHQFEGESLKKADELIGTMKGE